MEAVAESSGPASDMLGWLSQPSVIGWGVAGIVLLFVVLILLFLRLDENREAIVKSAAMTRNYLGVDLGFRLLAAYLAVALVAAVPLALKFVDPGKGSVVSFMLIALFLMMVIFAANLLRVSPSLSEFLRPGIGGQWRRRRKIDTAAILRRIAVAGRTRPVPVEELRGILSDILTVISLHVRDWRGSHKDGDPDVFSSLLLPDGDFFEVVARDAALNDGRHKRPLHVRYPRSGMITDWAYASKSTYSAGNLQREWPQSPADKPYKSVLVSPVFAGDNAKVIAVVSVDSVRKYFFKGFALGDVENRIEDGLLPYLGLIMLCMETLTDGPRTLLKP